MATTNTEQQACAACGFVPEKVTPYCPKCAKPWQGVRAETSTAAGPAATTTSRPLFEYHAVGVKTIASAIGVGGGIQSECEKRGREGWRLASSHYDAAEKRHVLIFERQLR